MSFDPQRKQRLRKQSRDILLKNRHRKGEFQYTQPSPSTYPYQWLWDSCFHAITLRHFEPEDAKRELRSAVSQQFDNGLIPHMIYWEPSELIDIPWGVKRTQRTSTITQPPIIAEAVWSIHEIDADADFVAEMYPILKNYYEYLLTARDPRANHLAGIINPDESGEDNSPRFDTVLGLPPIQTLEENFKSRLRLVEEFKKGSFDAPFMKQYFWVKDVHFNAILARNLRVLSSIAKRIGVVSEAAVWERHAIQVELAMRDRMFDGNLYWPTYGESYSKIKLKTWHIFSPLYANLLSTNEARALVEDHLLNEKEFLSTYLVPTVAMDEESFDPDGFWRGPTWIAVNWFIFRSMLDYGMLDIAERLLETSAQLLEKSGFREYYNPHTGAGLGAEQFTWGALIVDMIERIEHAP